MLTNYLYSILQYNLKIVAYIDVLRDLLLIFLIILSYLVAFSGIFSNKKINKILILELTLAILFTYTFFNIISYLFPTIRPISYFSKEFEQMFNSFPSRHSGVSFSVATIIFNMHPDLGIVLFLISILVGILSWFSLMHWPLDIITGWFLGFFIAVLILEFVKFLFRLYIKYKKS